MPSTAKPLPGAAKPPYTLKLYVSGINKRSQRAVTNLQAICDEYLKDNCNLEVVDIYQAPLIAKKEQILAAPTLIRQLPLPVRRLIGDLSQKDRVLVLLDLKKKK